MVPQLAALEILGCLLAGFLIHIREQSTYAAVDHRRGSPLDTVDEWLQGFRAVAQMLSSLQVALAFIRRGLEVLIDELGEFVLALGDLAVVRTIVHDAGDDVLLHIVVPRFDGGFTASSTHLLLCVLDEQAGDFSYGVEGCDAGGAGQGDGGWSHADTGEGRQIEGVDFHCGVCW